MSNPKRQWTTFILVFCGTGLLLMLLLKPQTRDLFSPGFWRNIIHVGHVMLIANDEYVDTQKVGYDELSGSALKQMIHELDEYSGYMDEDDYADFAVQTEQHYAGIGAEVQRIDAHVTITGLFEGSPAAAAGMRVGDQIVRVGEDDARGWSVNEMVSQLRGPEGEPLVLGIYRPQTGETLDLSFARAAIDFPSVRRIELSPEGIGSLQITGFGRNTGLEFNAALNRLEAAGMRGLIIDLRGNPGGLLSEAVSVVGEFVPADTVVVTRRGRDGTVVEEERTSGPGRASEYPVAVLIDGSSASASEIVSGALQDLGRAVVVGQTSFGKGSVQRVYEFVNGDGLRLTSAMYYLPSGRTIHKSGVQPDIEISGGSREVLAERLQQGHMRTMDATTFESRFGFAPSSDAASERAREVLLGLIAYRSDANTSAAVAGGEASL